MRTWVVTTDRFGGRCEALNTEHGMYVVDGTGAGLMRWTVIYADGDYGMTTTKREARAWAFCDLTDRENHARIHP